MQLRKLKFIPNQLATLAKKNLPEKKLTRAKVIL